MKAVAKLLAAFFAWRWAPAAGLLSASTLLVLVVVGLVPNEIGVPVSNTKFAPRAPSGAAAANTSETTTASFANGTQEPVAVGASPTPATRLGIFPCTDRTRARVSSWPSRLRSH